MAAKEMLVYYCVGTLLISGVGSLCVPAQCDCEKLQAVNESDFCNICTNISFPCFDVPEIPLNCTKDFKASLNSSTGYDLFEGDELILNCNHNLPTLTLVIEWQRDKQTLGGQNNSMLKGTVYTTARGTYRCIVHSPCGTFTSNEQQVNVKDSVVLLVLLCGLFAVVLVLAMGMAMKYKLKKDNAALKRRQEERAKALQMTTSMTPRDA
ncbi:unnamed protein product [Lota lota]